MSSSQLVDIPDSSMPPALPNAPADKGTTHEKQRASDSATADLHLWWRNGSQGGTTNTYHHVAVLLIRWRADLDELKCAQEVESLEKVFRETFNYETKVIELDDNTNATLQLCRNIGSFVETQDRLGNLIIIYYSGHGTHVIKSGHLELHPRTGLQGFLSTTKSNHHVRADWQDAEQHLIKHANCDVLSILDCCFAGNVHKGGLPDQERTYQLLSAGDKDEITQKPGAESFTTALIESLTELAKKRGDKPFTTVQLRDHIANQPSRKDNPPRLAHRLYVDDRPIFLGPLLKDKRKAPQGTAEPSRAFLTLRLPLLKEELNKEQVERLARNITTAAKGSRANVQRVDLIGLSVSAQRPSMVRMVHTALPGVKLRRMAGITRLKTSQGMSNLEIPAITVNGGDETPIAATSREGLPSAFATEAPQHLLDHNAKKRKRPLTPESERATESFEER